MWFLSFLLQHCLVALVIKFFSLPSLRCLWESDVGQQCFSLPFWAVILLTYFLFLIFFPWMNAGCLQWFGLALCSHRSLFTASLFVLFFYLSWILLLSYSSYYISYTYLLSRLLHGHLIAIMACRCVFIPHSLCFLQQERWETLLISTFMTKCSCKPAEKYLSVNWTQDTVLPIFWFPKKCSFICMSNDSGGTFY